MKLYAALLEEAKLRMGVIESALSGSIPLEGPFLQDTCFLQLRFLCELIALSCLVIHGDIDATKRRDLRKKWHAKEIIERLEEIHPSFYPVPGTLKKTPTGWHIDKVDEPFLSKSALVELYGKCGDALHRGDLKRLLKSSRPRQFMPEEVARSLQKIRTLLDVHSIPLFQEGTVIVVLLRDEKLNGSVLVRFASTPVGEESSTLKQNAIELGRGKGPN